MAEAKAVFVPEVFRAVPDRFPIFTSTTFAHGQFDWEPVSFVPPPNIEDMLLAWDHDVVLRLAIFFLQNADNEQVPQRHNTRFFIVIHTLEDMGTFLFCLV